MGLFEDIFGYFFEDSGLAKSLFKQVSNQKNPLIRSGCTIEDRISFCEKVFSRKEIKDKGSLVAFKKNVIDVLKARISPLELNLSMEKRVFLEFVSQDVK